MKFTKTLTVLSATILSMLCTNVYGAVVSVPDGSGGIHAWQPQTNAVDSGNGAAITEGDDLVITVKLRDASNHSMPKNADSAEGGAFLVVAVTETGQSSYNNEDGQYKQVNLIADGHYGLYIADGKSEASFTIPTRANDYPNSHSTVQIHLRTDGWGINTIDDARNTIRIEDNDAMQPGGYLQIDFCPGLASQVREGESFQLSLCLDRASGTGIPLEVEILNATATDPVEPHSDGDLAGPLLQIGGSYTIPAGVTRHDLPPIEALRDSAFENDEGFTVFVGYPGSLAVEVGSSRGDTKDVVIKDTTRVHLNLGYEVELNYQAEEENPDFDTTMDPDPVSNPDTILVTLRLFTLSLNAAYPDSTNNTCTNDGDTRAFNYKVRFSTDSGQNFLENKGFVSQQETSIGYGQCATFSNEVIATIADNLYGTHRVTMEIRDDFPPTAFGSQISFPQGRTKTFTVNLGTAPPPPPPVPLTPEEMAELVAAAGPNIVTVSADKTTVEEGGSVTFTFTRNHAVGTHTRRIRMGADSNINVIARYEGCNALQGIICIALGNLAVPRSLRFDDGVDTLQFTMHITNDDFIYSAATISATVAQATGDTGDVDKRVDIVLVETDVETATEYTARFAPVENCVPLLVTEDVVDENGNPVLNEDGSRRQIEVEKGETCTSDSANQNHGGKWIRWVEVPIEFSAEPNAMSYRDMIDRVAGGRLICGIVSAENGTLIGARRAEAPSNKKWVVRVHPETGAKDILMTVHRNGNPSAACDTRKRVEFGETNMRLATSVSHAITRPSQITIADVTVSEDLRTLQCTRTHHDPVLDGEGDPVLDEDDSPTTTTRIENFQRIVPSRFLITAVLDKPAQNGMTLDFDPPAGWDDDVDYGYVVLPDDLLEMSAADRAAAIHKAECRNNTYGGSRSLRIEKGETTVYRMMVANPDEVDEGDETYDLEFYFLVSGAPNGRDDHEGYGAYLADNVVRVTIENSDPIPGEWVAGFSHSVGKTVVRNVSNRMGVLRKTSDGEVGTWVTFDRDSFANGPLSGSTEGFMVGMDRSWQAFDAGLAISSSHGTGKFNDLELAGDLLGVYPYVQVQPEDHYALWGTAGMSYGSITVQEGDKEGYETNMSMSMGAAGLHWDLLKLMGADVAFESDLMFVSAQSDAVRDLQAAETSSRRLHMAISGTHDWKFEQFRVTGSVDLGVVHEAGDVLEGFGTEGNLRVDFHHEHLSAGLTVGTSRTNGTSDSYNTNIGGSVKYDWSGDREGVIASYQPEVSMFGDEERSTATARLGYGFRRSGVLWTTYVLQSAQPAKLGLDAEYNENMQLQVEGSQDAIQANLRMSW